MSDDRSSPILVLDADAESIVAELEKRRPGHYLAARGADRVGHDVAICLGSPDLVLEAAPRLPGLRWVQSTWAGVAPLLPLLEQRPGLVVSGVKGIFGPMMAEYVFGWIAALDRRMFDYVRLQGQRRWQPLPERPGSGRRMLLLGLGSIGCHLARVAPGFGFEVTGVSRSGQRVDGVARVRPVDALPEAAAGADVLVAVLPDTPATRGLIDASVLEVLAPGAMLVNVGRGSVVVDSDLLKALEAGRLSAAVLDVFREEPLPESHPFWSAPGLYVTPHTAALTPPAAVARLFLDNLQRWHSGRDPAFRVDPAKGY